MAKFVQGETFKSGNYLYRFERPSFTQRHGKLILRKDWWHLMRIDPKKGKHGWVDMHVDSIRALMEMKDGPGQSAIAQAERKFGCTRTNAFLRPRGFIPPPRYAVP